MTRSPPRSSPPSASGIAILSLPAAVGGVQVLIPAGSFDAPDGAMMGEGPWHLDDASGAALAQRLRARGRDLPVDYEHQTLLSASNGQPAPAAGWIASAEVSWTPGVGLTAPIRWTEKAAAHIAAGEYRFLSPVFRYAKNGQVSDLLSVALTNTPALPDLPEVRLAAASLIASTSEHSMGKELRERVLYLLNLPVTTSDEELMNELDKLKAMISAGDKAAATAGIEQILKDKDSQIAALTAQVSTAIPADTVNQIRAELAALKAEREARKRDELLTAALSDGRLIQGDPMHAHAMSLPTEGLEALLKVLKPIAALTSTQTGGKAPDAPAAPAANVLDYDAIYAARRVAK